MPPAIPELQSRYIPVHSKTYVMSSAIHWWKKSSPFIYPNVLINLLTCSKEQITNLRKDSEKELFLLTDSGGFQIISGTCKYTWEESLEKQIELSASKIFALDTPPLKQKFKGSLSQFTYMTDTETKKIVEENIDLAIKQSLYLKEKHPEERKKFCYVLHSKSLDQINFNIEKIEEKIGKGKYTEYFPGGIVYAPKESDILFITMAARHAYENFIKKGIYVHFLGMGSFYRIIVLIRNKISTFDSSSVLQGTRINQFSNPADINRDLFLPTEDFLFNKQFCVCPVCIDAPYGAFLKEKKPMIGRTFIAHNLWHMLKINVLLDAIPLPRYTEAVSKLYKLPVQIKNSLDFCDCADKIGFDDAYSKYKHYLKIDETKQKTLD